MTADAVIDALARGRRLRQSTWGKGNYIYSPIDGGPTRVLLFHKPSGKFFTWNAHSVHTKSDDWEVMQ